MSPVASLDQPHVDLTDGAFFDGIAEQALDPMLTLLAQLRSDNRPDKIDLGIGVYRTEDGKTPVMASVKAAEEVLVRHQASKDYLSPEGDPGFLTYLAPVVLGETHAADPRIAGIQSPGGTGALRLAAALIARANPKARVWLGQPTWAAHAGLMQAGGLETADYPFFDRGTQSIVFDDMMRALEGAAAGDVVLLHAGAGGVGLLLTQLVKARGGVVIATVGSAEKGELSRGAGADHVIGYDGVESTVREVTGGSGVPVVYDGVGRSTFDTSLASLRRRGMLALYGAASGPVPPVDPQRLNSGGSLFLTRPTLGHYVATRDELMWRAGELFDAVVNGRLSVRVGATFPLEEARAAHEALEGRQTTGKVLLIP